MEPFLTVENLSKTLGRVAALSDISMEIYPGEIVGLLGNTGAGKTVLARVLSGYYAADNGSICMADKQCYFDSPAAAHEIGIEAVFRHPLLAERMDITENVFIGSPIYRSILGGLFRVLDRKAMDAEVHHIAAQLAILLPPLHTKARDLQQSERVGVHLIRSWHRGFSLLILDEILPVLGKPQRRRLQSWLSVLRDQGKSTLFITQDINLAFTMTDRIMILRKGQLVASLRTKETTEEEIVHIIVESPEEDDLLTPMLWAMSSYEQMRKQAQEMRKQAEELDRSREMLRSMSEELQNSNLELIRRASYLATVVDISQRISSEFNLDKSLPQITNLIQRGFEYNYVCIFRTDAKKENLELAAASEGVGEQLRQNYLQLSLKENNLNCLAVREDDSILINDVSQDSRVSPDELLPETQARLVVPVRFSGEILGTLDVQSARLNAFGDDDTATIQSLADQIAMMIRNAKLYQAEQRRRRQAEILQQVSKDLMSTLDIERVPGLVLERLAEVVPYERASVMMRSKQKMVMSAVSGFPDEQRAMQLDVQIREDDVFVKVSELGHPLVVNDVTKEPGWSQVEWLPLNRSWMGVPLSAFGDVVGMISLTREDANAFTEEDASIAFSFAGQAAIAVANARLYDGMTRFSQDLERAYKRLERLDKSKADFINIAAHELRTPLTIIIGFADMLAADEVVRDNAFLNQAIEKVVTNTKRLNEIVSSMLDVSKIDSRALSVFAENMLLVEVMNKVEREFSTALQDRNLHLTVTGFDGLPQIIADSDLLFKVLYNLVNNAIKYTPDGGCITVESHLMQNDSMVEIIVADTGIGIDPEHHDLIFEKFYQTGDLALHSSGKTKFKGSGAGLGLSIAKGIVEAHGGKIWVESEKHDETELPGARFYVHLPVDGSGIVQTRRTEI